MNELKRDAVIAPVPVERPVEKVVVVDRVNEHKPAEAPHSASRDPAVPLAGVPETPVPQAGAVSTGPAVPSTDAYLTDASPNQDTSTEALHPPAATAAASGH